jgi:hypothetical protein
MNSGHRAVIRKAVARTHQRSWSNRDTICVTQRRAAAVIAKTTPVNLMCARWHTLEFPEAE